MDAPVDGAVGATAEPRVAAPPAHSRRPGPKRTYLVDAQTVAEAGPSPTAFFAVT